MTPEIRLALKPLLDKRKAEVGDFYYEYEYQEGWTSRTFLNQHRVGPGPADPHWAPYYLLIVGDPAVTPFSFQYQLDVEYAVGRLYFEDVQDYSSYADTVVSIETGAVEPLPKIVAFFGPNSPDDSITSSTVDHLVRPLTESLTRHTAWRLRRYIGPDATKDQLRRVLEGAEPPALLFFAGRGAVYPADHPLQSSHQGALVLGHRQEPKELSETLLFSEKDLGDVRLRGTVCFFFSDFGAGTLARGASNDGATLEEFATKPFVSRLAQSFLSSTRGGALAVLGYMHPTESLVATWPNRSPRLLFEETISQLLNGYPVGASMESFGRSYVELAVDLHALEEQRFRGDSSLELQIRQLSLDASLARGCILLGDPAVRLSPFASIQHSQIRSLDGQVEISDSAPPRLVSGAINDRVADKDQLDFSSYVEAFAGLIESNNTKPPLTIGIFGSWGTGKTFLLEHLAKELSRRGDWQRKGVGSTAQAVKVHTIKFNAWEYDASDAIWPGLVRKIMDRLESEVSRTRLERYWTRFRRNFRSLLQKERSRMLIVIGAAVVSIGLIVPATYLQNPNLRDTFLAIGGLAGLAGLAKLAADTLGHPLSQWITDLFDGGNYGQGLGQLVRIRQDLEFLEKRLRLQEERVLILIDDLDRCEPAKAVEMLQAIKLLLDFQSFIVCLGIDARIITRAIERHYQGLLGEAGASGYEVG